MLILSHTVFFSNKINKSANSLAANEAVNEAVLDKAWDHRAAVVLRDSGQFPAKDKAFEADMKESEKMSFCIALFMFIPCSKITSKWLSVDNVNEASTHIFHLSTSTDSVHILIEILCLEALSQPGVGLPSAAPGGRSLRSMKHASHAYHADLSRSSIEILSCQCTVTRFFM